MRFEQLRIGFEALAQIGRAGLSLSNRAARLTGAVWDQETCEAVELIVEMVEDGTLMRSFEVADGAKGETPIERMVKMLLDPAVGDAELGRSIRAMYEPMIKVSRETQNGTQEAR